MGELPSDKLMSFLIESLGTYGEENNLYFWILALKRLAPFP